MTFSTGVATMPARVPGPPPAAGAETLLRAADSAMYQSRRAARGGVHHAVVEAAGEGR